MTFSINKFTYKENLSLESIKHLNTRTKGFCIGQITDRKVGAFAETVIEVEFSCGAKPDRYKYQDIVKGKEFLHAGKCDCCGKVIKIFK